MPRAPADAFTPETQQRIMESISGILAAQLAERSASLSTSTTNRTRLGPQNASKLFLRLARTPNPHPPCSQESFARILCVAWSSNLRWSVRPCSDRPVFGPACGRLLTGLLGRAAIPHNPSHVCADPHNPGMCGIFSNYYRHAKTRFLFDNLCSRFPPSGPPPHVCELGFMKGRKCFRSKTNRRPSLAPTL